MHCAIANIIANIIHPLPRYPRMRGFHLRQTRISDFDVACTKTPEKKFSFSYFLLDKNHRTPVERYKCPPFGMGFFFFCVVRANVRVAGFKEAQRRHAARHHAGVTETLRWRPNGHVDIGVTSSAGDTQTSIAAESARGGAMSVNSCCP